MPFFDPNPRPDPDLARRVPSPITNEAAWRSGRPLARPDLVLDSAAIAGPGGIRRLLGVIRRRLTPVGNPAPGSEPTPAPLRPAHAPRSASRGTPVRPLALALGERRSREGSHDVCRVV